MSTVTAPSSYWCADRRRTGNGHKILYIQNIQSKSRFGGPKRLFWWGTVQSRRAGRGVRSYGSVTKSAVGTTVGKRTPSLRGYKSCGTAGRCGHRPLRNRIMGCVGEGLCPSHGRGRTPPLRRVTRSAVGRVVREADPYDIIPVFSPPPSLFSP